MIGIGKFFLIGLRRSGTSIFRNLVAKSPQVKKVLFEPHEILHAAQLLKIRRYKNSPYHTKVLESFDKLPKWSGAKLVLNPGIDALEWVWLERLFPEARFIFISRNADSNYRSYKKEDANIKRGFIPEEIYKPFHQLMNNRFSMFCKEYPRKSAMVRYESLLDDVDSEMSKVWNLLKVKSPQSLKSMIKKPKF